MEKKSLAVDPWGFCGTHEQKPSNYQSKLFKKLVRYIFFKFFNFFMVQYGILSVVVVMKINLKKAVLPIRGGLWWRVPGGTSADRYRVPRST